MVTGKVTLRSGAVHRYMEDNYLQDTFYMPRYVSKTPLVDIMGHSYFMGSFTVGKLQYIRRPQGGNTLTLRNLHISFLLQFKKRRTAMCLNCYFKIIFINLFN